MLSGKLIQDLLSVSSSVADQIDLSNQTTQAVPLLGRTASGVPDFELCAVILHHQRGDVRASVPRLDAPFPSDPPVQESIPEPTMALSVFHSSLGGRTFGALPKKVREVVELLLREGKNITVGRIGAKVQVELVLIRMVGAEATVLDGDQADGRLQM